MASPMVGHLPTNQFHKVLPSTAIHDRVIRKAEAREMHGLGFPAVEAALGAMGRGCPFGTLPSEANNLQVSSFQEAELGLTPFSDSAVRRTP